MDFLKWSVALIFAVSCASTNSNIESRDLEQIYRGAGVERYFLSDLPDWANFSASAGCKREGVVRYLNFKTINDSYSLGYEELVHLQHMLNKRFDSVRSESENQLYLKDEAFIYYNVYEQVAGGGREFLLPQFSSISLIWVDPFYGNLQKVDQLLESEAVGKGHPVIVSSCMKARALEVLAEERGWDRFGVKLISQEMFSPFSTELGLGHDYTLDFSSFLPNKELRLFSPYIPAHFKGIKGRNSFVEIKI